MAASRSPLFSRKQPGGAYVFTDETATTGNIFFVDSGQTTTGADAVGAGQNPDTPFLTIDYAVGQCTASNGDRIYVMPGHTEAVIAASGIDFDVAGIEVIGLGVGTSRPTITLGTATTATVVVGAVNVTLKNLRFVGGINDLAIMLDVNFGNFLIEGCEFRTASTFEAFCMIDIATTFDDVHIKNCRFFQPSDPEGTTNAVNTGCIYLVDSEDVVIEGCYFSGNFESSIVHNKTTAATNLWIKDCFGNQALSGAEVLTLVTGGTGGISNCAFTVDNAADATTEANFVIIGATSPFGFFNTNFMNDNAAGGNLALPVTADMA